VSGAPTGPGPAGATPVEVGVVDVLVWRPAAKGWLVLALERAQGTRCAGTWETIHGRVHPGEVLERAALRELQEEAGLTPERLFSITMHPFYLVPSRTVQLAAVFAAIVAPDAKVVRSAEHSRHAWLTPNQARRRFTWPHERRALDDARVLIGTPGVWDVIELQR